MKLKEIVIDPKKLTLDRLVGQSAELAIAYYYNIEKLTHKFYYSAYEVFPADIINDWLDELYQFKTQIEIEFAPHSQTYKIIEFLIQYFENN